MTRTEFSAKVKREAWERCAGKCEWCTAKLYPGKFAYDHARPDGLGGTADLPNCQVLCDSCHGSKTVEQDRPRMQKADNIRNKHLGIKKPRGFRKPPPGYSAWTRRIES